MCHRVEPLCSDSNKATALGFLEWCSLSKTSSINSLPLQVDGFHVTSRMITAWMMFCHSLNKERMPIVPPNVQTFPIAFLTVKGRTAVQCFRSQDAASKASCKERVTSAWVTSTYGCVLMVHWQFDLEVCNQLMQLCRMKVMYHVNWFGAVVQFWSGSMSHMSLDSYSWLDMYSKSNLNCDGDGRR